MPEGTTSVRCGECSHTFAVKVEARPLMPPKEEEGEEGGGGDGGEEGGGVEGGAAAAAEPAPPPPPPPPPPELRRCKGGFKDSLPKLPGIVGGKRYKSLRRSLGRGWRYADTSMLCSGGGRAKMGLKLALRAHSAICEIGWRVEGVVVGEE